MSTKQDHAYGAELAAETNAIQRLLLNLSRVKALLQGNHLIATRPINGYHWFFIDGLLVAGFDVNPDNAVQATTEQDVRDWCQSIDVLDDINNQAIQWLADPKFVPNWGE